MIDNLACERRHQVYKTWSAAKGDNYDNWDRRALLAMQLNDLEEIRKLPDKYFSLRLERTRGVAKAVSPWRTYKTGQPVVWSTFDKCGVIYDVVQDEADILLLLEMYQLENTISFGLFEWKRTSIRHRVVLCYEQQGLLLPEYWLHNSESLLTLW